MTAAGKISIVIPVRNGGRYIRACIDSILGQTYEEFSLLVLDNCSEDGTLEILNSFHDSRISILRSVESLDIESSWSRILDLELADYMTILSHDDVLYRGYLQAIMDLIHDEPDASLYHSHFDILDSSGEVLRRCRIVPPCETGEQFLRRAHSGEEDLVGSGYVMRSRDYKAIGGFPRLHRLLFADALCWYRLASLSFKACHPMCLYGFRTHPGSSGRAAGLMDFYRGALQYLDALEKGGHFNRPGNEVLARKFLWDFCEYRHRLILFDLIDHPDCASLRRYEQEWKSLMSVPRKQWPFPMQSGRIRFYRWLARSPFPLIGRVILAARWRLASLKHRVFTR